MAILWDKAGAWGLEITPVRPSLDGPRDAYDVVVRRGDEEVFRHQYNVHGWQIGHSEVFRMARAFQHARRLIDAKTEFGLDRYLEYDKSYNEEVCLHVEVIWLHVLLWGRTYGRKRSLAVRFFLWANPDEDYAPNAFRSTPLASFVGNEFRVRPKAAMRFGKELEAECRKAKRRRKKLGIPHFDDNF